MQKDTLKEAINKTTESAFDVLLGNNGGLKTENKAKGEILAYSFIVPSHLPGHGGWGNGYVAIPKGHPLYEMDYDQIYEDYEISVHGGLTFANTWDDKAPNMWVIGFDTLHSGDDINPMTKQEVQTEADNLLDMVNNLKHSEYYKRRQFEKEAIDNYSNLKQQNESLRKDIEGLQEENKRLLEEIQNWKDELKSANEDFREYRQEHRGGYNYDY